MSWASCDDDRQHWIVRVFRNRDGVTLRTACGTAFGPSIRTAKNLCENCAAWRGRT
ncbi:hypothetical protein [Amycolatopsis minnesotensis]|uniref:Uncharacterized protein n=1 Tax=Amycolatopsis minnesotensis TaxID=337894 RepID=A0ABN2S0S1_9PSEU